MDGQKHALHPTKEAKKQAMQQQKQESKLQSKKKSAQTPMHTCLLNQLIIRLIIHFGVVFYPPSLSSRHTRRYQQLFTRCFFSPNHFGGFSPAGVHSVKKKYRGIKLYVANFFIYITLLMEGLNVDLFHTYRGCYSFMILAYRRKQ